MAYTIYRVNLDSVVTFAAQELKKYLRMMMPRCGKIPSCYDPKAKTGFRLGLMSDFGMDPQVEDLYLDDVVYIEADGEALCHVQHEVDTHQTGASHGKEGFYGQILDLCRHRVLDLCGDLTLQGGHAGGFAPVLAALSAVHVFVLVGEDLILRHRLL